MAIGAIVGPISLLFIRKTLEIGLSASCTIAFGTTLGDGFYAVVAALGFSVISNFVEEQEVFIKISGGELFLYLIIYKSFLLLLNFMMPVLVKVLVKRLEQLQLVSYSNRLKLIRQKLDVSLIANVFA